jgi:hypothetical protein
MCDGANEGKLFLRFTLHSFGLSFSHAALHLLQ